LTVRPTISRPIPTTTMGLGRCDAPRTSYLSLVQSR
jgi:hypothetical protein